MSNQFAWLISIGLALAVLAACATVGDVRPTESSAPIAVAGGNVEYLEIVTPEVEATCKILSLVHGLEFSEVTPELGFARVAAMKGGGRVGVRAPVRDSEAPVVRPYVLVDDIEYAVSVAKANGAEIAYVAELPGQGKAAIYLLGGIDHGLWEDE